jgi:hypothetical protein
MNFFILFDLNLPNEKQLCAVQGWELRFFEK